MKRAALLVAIALLVAVAGYYRATERFKSQPEDVARATDAGKERERLPTASPAETTAETVPQVNAPQAAAIPDLYAAPDFVVRLIDEPLLEGSWTATRTELVSRANQGESEANYLLYRAAYTCYKAPRTDTELAAALDKARAPYPYGRGRFIERPSNSEEVAREISATYEYCRGSDIDDVANYVQWLEVAAETGDIRAQLAWGADYPGDDDLDSNDASDANVLRERQERYVEFLERAKLAGSVDAAARLANHYYTQYTLGRDAPRSLQRAVANLYPYAWYRWMYEGSDRSLRRLESLGNQLTPFELREAIEEGRRFVESANCCLKMPDM